MKIGNREIGVDQPPYIIAEIGANHDGSFGNAISLIKAAKEAGADAVKFQCYTADTITIDSDRPEFMLTEGPWQGRRLYDLYRECETPFDWFPRLDEYAREIGITWFASAFDESAVDLLDKLDCPAIKIASFELGDTPLIGYAAQTGRPLILSTGMGTDKEIERGVLAAARGQAGDVALLHCVSGYPTPMADARLDRLRSLQFLWQNFDVGISDHSVGPAVPIAATALHATIIEKHMTLPHLRDTPDGKFSMETLGFAIMVNSVREIWKAMQLRCGEVKINGTINEPNEVESAQTPLRRSLYVVKDMAAGEPFTKENVRSIRPGAGLAPARIGEIIGLGRVAKVAIPRGTPLKDEHLA